QHRDAGVAGEEPVLALHRMAVFAVLVLRRRDFLDGGGDQALVRVGRAASATGRTASTANEGLIRLEEAAQRTGRVFAQPMTQLAPSTCQVGLVGCRRLAVGIGVYRQPMQQISAQTRNFWVLEALCSAAVT